MYTPSTFPLRAIEPQLRALLPADLYAMAWIDSSADTLFKITDHFRTLQRTLSDYLPPPVSELIMESDPDFSLTSQTVDGTLMFTDLAGFTALMEANAALGRSGAHALLGVLNDYFAAMIEIIVMSGGRLLEFTGDAMLIEFLHDPQGDSTAQAIRAGLRMQRAMQQFSDIATREANYSLSMRVGIHTGRYLAARIGTPARMDYVLMGRDVRRTKRAEGAGQVGRVCLTETTFERVRHQFRFEPGTPGYRLVVDDFTEQQLGEYEIVAPQRRRMAHMIVMDRSIGGLVSAIEQAVDLVEPLASYLPHQVLNLAIESTLRRELPPDFTRPTVLFVNLIGLSESADPDLCQADNDRIVAIYSHAFALINAAVESRGGTLKKVTYHLSGSDTMILFGVPVSHTDDAVRAANAALTIREIVNSLPTLTVGGEEITIACRIGMAQGPVFAAEVGSPRGRREFNVLGDTVNTSARLMAAATPGQILITQSVHEQLATWFDCGEVRALTLKGKAESVSVCLLHSALDA